jgi:hypothetical protein
MRIRHEPAAKTLYPKLSCLILVFSFFVAVPKLQAQSADADLVRADCDPCEIGLSRIATLRDNPSLLGIGNVFSLSRSANGFYYLVATQFTGQVAVFDEVGRIRRILGRAGEGPGEFRFVRSVAAIDTTLFVLDIGNHRVQRFSLPAETLRGQTTLPVRPNYMAVLESGTFIVNAFLYDPEVVGQLYHVVDSSGRVVGSFGYDGEIVRADQQFTRLRSLAPRSRDSFWAANMTRYRLEAWNVDGRRIRTLERNADWFAPHASAPRYDGSAAPAPTIPAIHQDSLGLLWVLISVADPEWRSAVRSNADDPSRSDVDRRLFYDTIIEVIDPTSATLLGTHRLDAYVTTFAGSRLIAVDEELPNGEPAIGVFQLDLPRANSSTGK